LNMSPITDRKESLAVLATSATPSDAAEMSVNELQMTALEGLLPAPAEGISPEELARLKQDHGDLLRSLRREIESFAIDAPAIQPERSARGTESLGDAAQERLSEISPRMNERRWPRLVFGSLCGILAAAVPVAGAAMGGAALAGAAGAPGLASAVYAAFGGHKEPGWEESYLAYAALARQRLGGPAAD